MKKVSNKEVLEKVAKDIAQAKNQEEIDAFVKSIIYSMLLGN